MNEKKSQGKSPFKKPRLTDEYKANRVLWVKMWGPFFLGDEFPVCYLDKEWFYPTTYRRTLRFLPCSKHEKPGVDIIQRPKTHSCRFPIKVMCLGVVGIPKTVGGRHFNSRIFLECVSKTRRIIKKKKHQ